MTQECPICLSSLNSKSCSTCKFEFTNQKDRIFYLGSNKKVSYPEDEELELALVAEKSYWFRLRKKLIWHFVKTVQDPILDLGAGNGYNFYDYPYKKIISLEASAISCELMSQRDMTCICGITDDLKIKDETVETITMFDVLEHIEDKINFLKYCYSKLKPGGHLLITVPAFNFLWSYEDESAGHFRRYTITQLKNEVEQVGFEHSRSTYFFSALVLPIFLIRSIPFRLKSRSTLVSTKTEHSPGKFISFLIETMTLFEQFLIRKRFDIPFGSSIFLVAKKT